MAWKKGPLPAGTYYWGGVVKVGQGTTGFYFADFRGDHVTTPDGERIEADEVAFYDNSLRLPEIVEVIKDEKLFPGEKHLR